MEHGTIDKIIKEACDIFSCDVSDLMNCRTGRGRIKDNVAFAKQSAMTLIAQKTNLGDKAIAKIFRNHRCVAIHSRMMIRDLCSVDDGFREKIIELETRIN